MNKKGIAGAALVILVAGSLMGAAVATSTATNIADASKSGLLKKNGQSVWAHMQSKCSGVNPDSRCILK